MKIGQGGYRKHILNFHNGKINKLPIWLKPPYNVIFGVGDSGNIDYYKKYNVYIILSEIKDKESCEILKNNLSKLENTNKVLCFMDVGNDYHVKQFTNLFYKKCKMIDVNGLHCVHFDYDIYPLLLTKDGKATGFDEMDKIVVFSENALLNLISQKLQNDDKKYIFPQMKFISNGKYITNVQDKQNIRLYVLLLIIQYQIMYDIKISPEVWQEIKEEWNEYGIVINKLLHIFYIIIRFKNSINSDIKPLTSSIWKYRHIEGNDKFIAYVLHYPLSKSVQKKRDMESARILDSLINK